MFSAILSVTSYFYNKTTKGIADQNLRKQQFDAEIAYYRNGGAPLSFFEQLKYFFSIIKARRPGEQQIHNTVAIGSMIFIFIITFIVIRKLK